MRSRFARAWIHPRIYICTSLCTCHSVSRTHRPCTNYSYNIRPSLPLCATLAATYDPYACVNHAAITRFFCPLPLIFNRQQCDIFILVFIFFCFTFQMKIIISIVLFKNKTRGEMNNKLNIQRNW